MSSGENIPVQEIVIIRRGGHGEADAHHGGMWKIAFADFMTAMMAFFLVMWLVSATDDKTKAEISTYFNPIKLPDQMKSEKALQTADSNAGENEEAVEHRNKPKGDKSKGSGEQEGKTNSKTTDDALFADPYGILSKLATQAVRLPVPSKPGMRKDGTTQFSGGTAFRDQFDPDFRKRAHRDDVQVQAPAAARDVTPDADSSFTSPSPLARELAPVPPKAPVKTAAATPSAEEKPAEATPPEAKAAASAAAPAEAPGDGAAQAGKAQEQAETDRLEAEVRTALTQTALRDLPDVSVARTSEGLLISLTDRLDFEMFSLASAQPRPELVVALESIGKVLQARSEKIVVRGHTDARPFRSGTYDNWRLSSDRANMAHFMLARGGLPEARFERIEGYADKMLKMPSDPKAAANRRIEILLRTPTSS